MTGQTAHVVAIARRELAAGRALAGRDNLPEEADAMLGRLRILVDQLVTLLDPAGTVAPAPPPDRLPGVLRDTAAAVAARPLSEPVPLLDMLTDAVAGRDCRVRDRDRELYRRVIAAIVTAGQISYDPLAGDRELAGKVAVRSWGRRTYPATVVDVLRRAALAAEAVTR